MDDLTNFLRNVGQEVDDSEEESFLLFSQDIPSSNLGFVDSRATAIDLTIHEQDYTIHQSPTLLSSSRAGGTTGAVLWKITPLFAEWISASKSNPLWTSSLLSSSSTVVELGCGISALTALTLSPLIQHYIATDQEYVRKLFHENLQSNPPPPSTQTTSRTQPNASKSKGKRHQHQKHTSQSRQGQGQGQGQDRHHAHPKITFTPLDWELDAPETLKESIPSHSHSHDDNNNSSSNNEYEDDHKDKDKGFDLLLSCDCIYNEALIAPFVRTCAEICRLRPVYSPPSKLPDAEAGRASSATSPSRHVPTVCIIAQQQRSPDVFEAWLQETMEYFWVWRLRDEVLGGELKLGTGYLVHLLLLKG